MLDLDRHQLNLDHLPATKAATSTALPPDSVTVVIAKNDTAIFGTFDVTATNGPSKFILQA